MTTNDFTCEISIDDEYTHNLGETWPLLYTLNTPKHSGCLHSEV